MGRTCRLVIGLAITGTAATTAMGPPAGATPVKVDPAQFVGTYVVRRQYPNGRDHFTITVQADGSVSGSEASGQWWHHGTRVKLGLSDFGVPLLLRGVLSPSGFRTREEPCRARADFGTRGTWYAVKKG